MKNDSKQHCEAAQCVEVVASSIHNKEIVTKEERKVKRASGQQGLRAYHAIQENHVPIS